MRMLCLAMNERSPDVNAQLRLSAEGAGPQIRLDQCRTRREDLAGFARIRWA